VADGERIAPEVLARLLPYLTESIMIVGLDGKVSANLAPPGGILGHGDREGTSGFEYYHPDDMAWALELGVSALNTEPGWMGAGVIRMRKVDGTYERYELTVVNHTDDPVVNGFICRSRSIEGFDTSPYNVPEHGELIESLAEAVPVAIIMLDLLGLPLYMNRAAQDLLGLDLAELREVGLPELDAPIQERIAEPGVSSVEVRHGEHVLAARLVSRGHPGRVASIVVTLEDITELSRRANHDPLTGLPNRAAVLDELNSRLEDSPTDVTVIYCDLDGFKLVNDRFGHAVGDRVLMHVAEVLRGAVREGDVVGRIGGDEFVFVCTDLDDGGLVAVSDRITNGLQMSLSPDGPDVTVSLGVARGRPGDSSRDVLHRADVSMYAAKRATEVG
jgi:diguanylate cyclase (GGDEF)-like protein/PAS domain S-box-containing protein